MVSDASDTSDIPGDEDKLSRMDAAAILYDEAARQKWKYRQ
jgi:hypothetical protein